MTFPTFCTFVAIALHIFIVHSETEVVGDELFAFFLDFG